MSELSKASPTTTAAFAPQAAWLRCFGRLCGQELRKAGYKVQKQTFTFPFFRERGSLLNSLSSVLPPFGDFETADLHLLGQRRCHRPGDSDR